MKQRICIKAEGITLIALVVTIIVLLILAGVSITVLLGDNGIITMAQEAKERTEQSTMLESLRTKAFEKQLENLSLSSSIDYMQYFKQNNIINNDDIVNVDSVTKNASLGRGKQETGDYYYIKNGNLYYVAQNKKEKQLGSIFDADDHSTTEDIFTYADAEKTILTGVDSKYLQKYEVEGDQTEKFWSHIYIDGREITEITIPSRIKIIEEFAFQRFRALEKINLNDGLEKINGDAFSYCEKLTFINIPATVSYIGEDAFYGISREFAINLLGKKALTDFEKLESNWNRFEYETFNEYYTNINFLGEE